jgi:hypothetical protein
MPFCENCGKPVNDFDAVCPSCGRRSAVPCAVLPLTTARSVYRAAEGFAVRGAELLGFVGSLLLMAIPIAGFILTIVWAAGGTGNHNRRNLARGYLLMIAILAAVYLIVIIYFIITYGSVTPLTTIYGIFDCSHAMDSNILLRTVASS